MTKAFLILGQAKERRERSTIPDRCVYVTITINSDRLTDPISKSLETIFFDSNNEKVLTDPITFKSDLKKLFTKTANTTNPVLSIQTKDYTENDYTLFSVQKDKEGYTLFNSGVYQIGVVKEHTSYSSKTGEYTKEQIEKAFDRATIPRNIGLRIESRYGKRSTYSIDEITSVVHGWPFYEDIYKLCLDLKNAISVQNLTDAKELRTRILNNIEIATATKDSRGFFMEPITKYINELASMFKTAETSKMISKKDIEAANIVYSKTIQNIDESQKRFGTLRQSTLFEREKGVYYTIRFVNDGRQTLEPQDVQRRQEPYEQVRFKPVKDIQMDTISPSTQTSATIRLGEKFFNVDRSIDAYSRRSAYFLNKQGYLTKDEQDILIALGIDKTMEKRLNAYLPRFFDVLPDCQTDTSVYLNKQCEIPYYVLWSTKFADGQQVIERVKENKKLHVPRSDYDSVVDSSVVQAMSGKVSAIDQLFTLIKIRRN